MCTPNQCESTHICLASATTTQLGHCHVLKDPKIPIPTYCLQCLLQLPQVEQPSKGKPGPATPAFKFQCQTEKWKVLPGLAPTHCLGILLPGISKHFHPILATSFFFCTWKAPLHRAFSSSSGSQLPKQHAAGSTLAIFSCIKLSLTSRHCFNWNALLLFHGGSR